MDTRPHRPGQGPLSLALVVDHAQGMLRLGFVRVAVVALILFVPPALLTAAVEAFAEDRPNLFPGGGSLLALGVAAVFRLMGPVIFAGYLDEAVGSEYFHARRHSFRDVLRSLPWVRLLIADLIVVIGASVGLAVFIVPGIIFYLFFGLVGPVIVQERRAVRDAFRRTAKLPAGRRWCPSSCWCSCRWLPSRSSTRPPAARCTTREFGARVIIEWLIAAVIGGTVGLLEVGLATELMARHPEPTPVARLEATIGTVDQP